jgi:hypothetical protein
MAMIRLPLLLVIQIYGDGEGVAGAADAGVNVTDSSLLRRIF